MTAAPSNPSPGNAAPAEARPASHAAAAGAGSSSDAPGPAGRLSPPPGSQRPPAPPPPPPPAWAPPPPAAAVEPAARKGPAPEAARRHARHRLHGEPPARIALANRQPVFVTLNDISAGGCSMVRKGRLELSNGDAVVVDIWTRNIETKLSIHARVCWCSHQETTSRAGLRFVETTHRLLRQIETFVQHFQRPLDESRPQAKQPPSSSATGLSGDARPRRGAPAGMRTAELPRLASMPRPARLTSLDLQRRMRPAHRHEVARIAEETGIHIQTLYGWLRTLRLEGEVNPERPRDPEDWSATDKFSALLQVVGMGADERSTYCSRHGITEEQLERWRLAALQANEKPLLILRAEEQLQRLRVRDQREIRRLQKELRRRERSASINDELLQVVRKLQTLWEQGDTP